MRKASITVRGLVQGVSFRYYTEKKAYDLGLVGWVRNRSDGAVDIVAEGEPGELEALAEWCKSEGAPASRVDDVQVADEPAEGIYKDFRVRY